MRRVYLAYCVSGFVSLGYQVVWFRIFADRFGSSSLTFALVVVNFILGLGLGAFVSRRFSDRLGTFPLGRPLTRAYGLVELGVSAAVPRQGSFAAGNPSETSGATTREAAPSESPGLPATAKRVAAMESAACGHT